jgi:hypothetical protein
VDLATAVLRPDGINAIEVFAFDAKGLVASRQVNRVWKTPPRKDVSPPSLYALVAGVSAYSGAESMNLQWAAKDAADIANALRLGANRLFGAERLHITLLTSASSQESGRPTKKNILRHFQEIAQQAQPADAVVLYLAGHGTAYGRDRYYYLTQDARGLDLSDETLRDVSTLSSEEISRWLQMEVKALKQVIILDTCAAGAATSELVKLAEKRDLSPDQIRAIELLKDATGSHVLMGSAADKVSYEASRYGQGLLTYALLAGMKGEVPLDGENLDVLKWFSYAQLRVEGLARGIGGIQKPVLSSPRGSSFPIAMLNEEEKRAIPLARAKPQLLRVLCLDENDGAVGLTPQLRARLRQLSYSSASGSPQVEPALVYLDNVLDDLPGAILPRVRYRRSRDGLKVTLRLFRDNVALHQHELNLPKDAEEAASRLAMYLQSILVKLKN